MSETLAIEQRVTQYSVSALPEGLCMDGDVWAVSVEYRGDGAWAVKHLSQCLGANGKWDYEPIPSSRTDKWKDKHRFTEEEALRLAREAAPSVCVNGLFPADLVRKYASRANATKEQT